MSDAPVESQPFEIGEPFDLTDQRDGAGEPAAERRPRSRVRTLVLSGLLVIALAGAATLGYAGWQMVTQKDATLTTPARIGPLALDQSDDGRQTADYLQTALAAEIDLDQTIGAVYADGTTGSILFFGGTA